MSGVRAGRPVKLRVRTRPVDWAAFILGDKVLARVRSQADAAVRRPGDPDHVLDVLYGPDGSDGEIRVFGRADDERRSAER